MRIDFALRERARRICLELPVTDLVQDSLGQDRAGGVSCAKEKDAERSRGLIASHLIGSQHWRRREGALWRAPFSGRQHLRATSASGAHTSERPPQQSSVRYTSKSLMASKSAE